MYILVCRMYIHTYIHPTGLSNGITATVVLIENIDIFYYFVLNSHYLHFLSYFLFSLLFPVFNIFP
jgi:hypothetical protein